MIIPDINILVYAYNADAPFHMQAKKWWENTLNDTDQPVGLPWAVIFGFIRIMTHPKVLVTPLYPAEAVHHAQGWIIRSNVEALFPGDRHLIVFQDLAREVGVAASLTTDLHIAALAIEYNAVVYSNDTDFARFSGVRVKNPLG